MKFTEDHSLFSWITRKHTRTSTQPRGLVWQLSLLQTTSGCLGTFSLHALTFSLHFLYRLSQINNNIHALIQDLTQTY